ncbi:MAG: xylose isomerase [Planctomyces sp.]|nr:xylose isomerase [Planctomyces sp.]
MDRRNFLVAAAATATATAVLSRPGVAVSAQSETSVATPAAKGPLLKAVKYSMVGVKGTLAEKFAAVKGAGFVGIDMDARVPDKNEVVEAAKSTGLKVHGVVDYDHWSQPLSSPSAEVRAKGLAALEESLHDAKLYGGDTVLLVPAMVNKSISYEDAYKRSQIEIRKAIPLAKELGIKILFENVWNNFLLSPVECARYIDEFDSPLIGSYFDVGNIVNYGWPEHWIRTLGHRIGKIDIKEFSRTKANSQGKGAGFGVEIGDGDCDWPAVLTALKDVGFSGWATAEVGGGGEDRLKEISTRMDKIFSTWNA